MPLHFEIPQVDTDVCKLQYVFTINLWYNFSCVYFYKAQ